MDAAVEECSVSRVVDGHAGYGEVLGLPGESAHLQDQILDSEGGHPGQGVGNNAG